MELITKLKSAIVELDTTQSIIGAHADLKASRISRGLTEETPFDDAESQAISETIDAMRDLQGSMPLPIDWSRIGKVKPHIDTRRKELREQIDPVIRRCTLIRTSRTGFFQRMNGTNVVTTPSEMTAAAFETPELANQVVRELKKLGSEAQTESFGAFRRKSTMTHSLIEIGFEIAAIGGQNERTTVEV
jgi:hypothetical protein